MSLVRASAIQHKGTIYANAYRTALEIPPSDITAGIKEEVGANQKALFKAIANTLGLQYKDSISVDKLVALIEEEV